MPKHGLCGLIRHLLLDFSRSFERVYVGFWMAYNFKKIKVLVVEDNMPMAEMVQSLLYAFGVGEVVLAKNGEEGYEKYIRMVPDLIIADWMMKPVDGIMFTKRVRSDPRSPNPFVPLILMTGFSERKRVIMARDSGVTEFLVKPFTAKDLYKRIAQVIERPRQFVKTGEFFGPDRRRKEDPEYMGQRRRENDPDDAAQGQANKYQAAKNRLAQDE